MMYTHQLQETDTVNVDKLTEMVTQAKAQRAQSGTFNAETLLTNALKALDPEGTNFIPMDVLTLALSTQGEDAVPISEV